MNNDHNWHEWEPCQMHGHEFEASEDNSRHFVCKECFDWYDVPEEKET